MATASKTVGEPIHQAKLNHKAARQHKRTGRKEIMAETNRRSLRPLRRLLPYMLRYKGMVLGAGASLLAAAAMTPVKLFVPLANSQPRAALPWFG